MSEASDLMEHYREVRERLRNPPNAVPDTGINLRRGRVPEPPVIEPPKPVEPPVDSPPPKPRRKKDLTFFNILNFIAAEFSITGREIRCELHKRQFSMPRQIAMYLTARLTGRTSTSMGRYLSVDHSTVVHAKQKVRDMADSSTLCRNYLESLEARILANHRRTPLPYFRKPHLDTKKTEGNAEIRQISTVD